MSDGPPTPSETLYSEKELVLRPKSAKEYDEYNDYDDPRLEIHPLPDKESVMISTIPPKAPRETISHVPCDIVLAIDVSGSMSTEAPAPAANPSQSERNGLTVLDLTKHAARTILENLDERDRLGIVTFSTEAKVVQQLLPMTKKNKKGAWDRIENLKVESMTNLWHGILEGIKLFDDDERPNCVPAIMVLTDGLPNHMCPKQGYVPKLRSYNLPASLHTFGFGYSLKSGLLKSIAEIGGGNYAFIPDAGMIGTVFVHAVANLQSTFATSATLTLTTPMPFALTEAMGEYTRLRDPKKIHGGHAQLSIPLGNLQYGQSRDIILKFSKNSQHIHNDLSILASLDCTTVDGSSADLFTQKTIHSITDLPGPYIRYHISRAKICALLSSIFPLNSTGEHQVISNDELKNVRYQVAGVINELKNLKFTDPQNLSLLEDLAGEDPSGQVRLAVSELSYFNKWGKHYLLSLLNAHQKQICNSFKDPGPLMYGANSTLFVACRDKLDMAFDTLPAPKPTTTVKDKNGKVRTMSVDMRKYHRKSNPCFAGECTVILTGGGRVPVARVRKGMRVWTPKGGRRVVEVVATEVLAEEMYRIGALVITPWHPVRVGGRWAFPIDIADKKLSYTGTIYSLLLQDDEDAGAHAVDVGGCVAVTLGHGITEGGDARAHTFLGNHQKVAKSLKGLRTSKNGVRLSKGMQRNEATGLVCGFVPTSLEKRKQSHLQAGLLQIGMPMICASG